MAAQPPSTAAPGGAVALTSQPAAGVTAGGTSGWPLPGWSLEVTRGPNQGAVVQLDGDTRLGSGLDNDVVLADSAVAGQQAVFVLDGDMCLLDPLAEGMIVNGKPVPAGRFVQLRNGLLLQAGGTALRVHGPTAKPQRARWLLLAVPALLAVVGFGALGGIRLTGGEAVRPPPPVAVAPVPAPSSTLAAQALTERLREAGLSDQIRVAAGTGTVVAEGSVSGPVLARWKEHQVWFDSQYKGSLSLMNRVKEATPDEKPDIALSSVWHGPIPYLIVSNGDRYVVGSVVKGWLIEEITPDKIVLSRNGRRAQIDL